MTLKDATDWVTTIARGINAAQALHAVGLERRRGAYAFVLPALGIFSAGLAVGAGLSMFLSPESATKLKNELAKRASEAKDSAVSTGKSVVDAASSASHRHPSSHAS